MPKYLRVLHNKDSWYRSSPPDWLPPNEIPAAPLKDLLPKVGHNISLWEIADNLSNLRCIAAAVAARRDRIDKFDYAIFPQQSVSSSGLSITQTPGETPDYHANRTWHWNVNEVTADKLVRLAKEMYAKAEIGRILGPEIRELIIAGIQSGELKKKEINEKLLRDLGM